MSDFPFPARAFLRRAVGAVQPLAVAIMLVLAGCEGTTAPSAPLEPVPSGPSGPLVNSTAFDGTTSNAIAGPAISASGSVTPVAYVSMAPGTMPDGVTASIVNRRNGVSVDTTLAGGGLDPVGVPALAGDAIEIAIGMRSGEVWFARSIVPARRPPRIVRTSPARGRTDVAINASIIVVFSEPIALPSQPGHIRLLQDGEPVAGSVVRVAASAVALEFVPDEELVPGTRYEIEVSSDVTDLDGDRIEGERSSAFTTLSSGAQAPAPMLRLFIYGQPTAAAFAGEIQDEPVTVLVLDDEGPVEGFSGPITLRISLSADADATLAGTTTVNAVDGVAFFPDLVYNGAGSVSEQRRLHASAPGVADVASAPFLVLPAAGTAELAGIAVSFVEHQYPELPEHWFYAPQIRVRETGGTAHALVTRIDFTIPGVVENHWGCLQGLVSPGGTLDLIQEDHGDYTYSLGGSRARATSTAGSAVVTWRDGSGARRSTVLAGPVVPGGFPGTYSTASIFFTGPCLE